MVEDHDHLYDKLNYLPHVDSYMTAAKTALMEMTAYTTLYSGVSTITHTTQSYESDSWQTYFALANIPENIR